MLYKKEILILFLLMIAIGTVSAVNAADAGNDTVSESNTDTIINANENIEINEEIGINEENTIDLSEENVEIESAQNDEILNGTDAGTFTALQNKINAASENATINLENDYYYQSGDNIPIIVKSVTINGNGHKIDGRYQSGLLKILGRVNVQLNNITFQNGNDNEVIRVDHVDNLRIKNCIFVDNIGSAGGALIVTDTNYFEMNKTYFIDNVGNFGGALYINNTLRNFFFDCGFNGNDAQYGGGLFLENFNQSYFGGCIFSENTANFTGGGVYLDRGTVSIVDACTFADNAAGAGGGLFLGNTIQFDVYNSAFTRNRATNGGGLLIQTSNNVYLAGVNFDNNHANRGGATYFIYMTKCVVNTCTFNFNYADGDGSFGGAVFSQENNYIHFYNSNFVKNSADYIAGAITLSATEAIFESCNFTSNKGYYVGGAVLFESDAGFHVCNFVKNTATASDYEDPIGAIYATAKNYGAIIVDCTFSGNTAPTYEGDYKIFYGVKLKITQTGSTCDDKVVTATLTRLHGGTAISGQYVTLKIGGKTLKAKTNSKGQAVFKVNLPAKKYTATATHDGTGKYLTNSTKATVTLKKATPRIVASKKTFKVAAKTKKYTIVLKNSKGAVMKNTYVKITVNGKTYSAKTNSKGQATFNLNKLTRTGSFFGVIKYASTSYYNAVTKKVTIGVVK